MDNKKGFSVVEITGQTGRFAKFVECISGFLLKNIQEVEASSKTNLKCD